FSREFLVPGETQKLAAEAAPTTAWAVTSTAGPWHGLVLPALARAPRASHDGAVTRGGRHMFEQFSRSWELVKASAAVLRSDKELMLFPILSGIATLAVLATFLVPMLALRIFADGFGIGGAVFGFLFYFCQYTVIIFFNCALVGAAMIRLD